MARGWESKAIEDQMEEAARPQPSDLSPRSALTPEALERQRHREALRLARSRIVEQMSAARSEAHRRLLTRSLAAIDEQLSSPDQC